MGSGRQLALGTAQLGQPYGIANRSGQPSFDTARDIVRCAQAAAVDTLDTAMSYGDSEQILGAIGTGGLRIVTKLPPLAAEGSALAGWVRQCVTRSMERLRVAQLHALLLHRPLDATGPHAAELLAALRSLRAEGLVRKIGVSLYAASDLDAITQAMDLDLVQAPYNVLDRRLERSGWLARLQRHGVEVHVRSAFLQGLLLLPESALPAAFARWRPLWARWHTWTQQQGLTPSRAALGFALGTPGVDRVVVGVERVEQLQELLENATPFDSEVPDGLASDDLELIDPTRWKRT